MKILRWPILFFILYSIITLLIFNHRLPHIFTEYAMPDIDTDGGLWYQWFLLYAKHGKHLTDFVTTEGFPFGYDISLSPISNLIYSIHVWVIEYLMDGSWKSLIFITNVSSLITYPLSGIGAYLLSYYLTKNKWASFVAGLIFAFSFYHVFMGRGQMSINHIEFIPFYFLSLFYFLDKRNFFSLLLSCFVFATMFMADAYYAFFSGIFSFIVILFYKQENFLSKIKTLLIYYIPLFLILFLVNFNFVLSNLYLFDKQQAASTGRNSLPRNELTTILYYFGPLKFSLLYDKLSVFGVLIYNSILFVALAGIVYLKKNKMYFIFLLCFLLAVVLSAYIPSLFWINELYFKYFGMFRGVGRLALPAYLFMGLLVAYIITYGMQTKTYKKADKKILFTGFIFFCIIIILSSLNVDITWYRNTDFSKIAQVYEPIKENNKLHVLASYPFELNFQDSGFPQPYQLMGQIIHEKPLANGASLGSSISAQYQRDIRDITNPKTISNLQKYGVDTIVIYNKLLKNSSAINKKLSQDNHLTFIGRYTAPADKGYLSATDFSRDISVYQIKNVTSNTKPLFYTLDNTKVNYQKINEGKYLITLDNPKKNTQLVYNFPYDPKWELFEGDLTNKNELTFLNRNEEKDIVQQRHLMYANLWKISSPEKELTLYWKPQARNYLGFLVSTVTIAIVLLILSFILFRSIFILYFQKK